MKRLISLLLLVVATPLMGDTSKVGDYTWTYRINDDAAEIYNNNSANISPDSTGVVTMLSAKLGIEHCLHMYAAILSCQGGCPSLQTDGARREEEMPDV